MAYGKEVPNNYLQAGINEGVFLKKFTLTQVSTSKYQGNVIDVEIGNESSSVSRRIFPASPDSPNFDLQSGERTAWLRMLVGDNFTTKEGWEAAMNTVNSFETLYEACNKLLPKNYDKIPGRVVLTYAKKLTSEGEKYYLELPAMSWLNKPWTYFTVDPKKELGVSSRILLERPNIQTEKPQSNDSIPF
jgi:hypothetical protein